MDEELKAAGAAVAAAEAQNKAAITPVRDRRNELIRVAYGQGHGWSLAQIGRAVGLSKQQVQRVLDGVSSGNARRPAVEADPDQLALPTDDDTTDDTEN